ncbi:MAG: hypothetical protein ACFFDI_15025 [Promethearchaeota archaeon]
MIYIGSKCVSHKEQVKNRLKVQMQLQKENKDDQISFNYLEIELRSQNLHDYQDLDDLLIPWFKNIGIRPNDFLIGIELPYYIYLNNERVPYDVHDCGLNDKYSRQIVDATLAQWNSFVDFLTDSTLNIHHVSVDCGDVRSNASYRMPDLDLEEQWKSAREGHLQLLAVMKKMNDCVLFENIPAFRILQGYDRFGSYEMATALFGCFPDDFVNLTDITFDTAHGIISANVATQILAGNEVVAEKFPGVAASIKFRNLSINDIRLDAWYRKLAGHVPCIHVADAIGFGGLGKEGVKLGTGQMDLEAVLQPFVLDATEIGSNNHAGSKCRSDLLLVSETVGAWHGLDYVQTGQLMQQEERKIAKAVKILRR